MICRLASRADVPAILDIYRPYVEHSTVSFEYEAPAPAAFMARFEQITAAFPWYVAVQEETGRVVGYAYADRAFERRAYCWDADLSIYIDRAFHGTGIGRRLYALLEDDLRRMGYVTAYALVTGENQASLAFHRRLGYRIVAELPRAGYKMGRWLSVVWLEKRLRETENPGNAPSRFVKQP